MDENQLNLNNGDSIPSGKRLFRLVLVTERDKKNKAIPAVRCFKLKTIDENKLSNDWEELTTPEDTLARCGATFRNGKEEYKTYEDKEIYGIDVGFMRTVTCVSDIIYDPIDFNPKRKGVPNNVSHTSTIFSDIKDEDEPEIFISIRDHAVVNKVEVNMTIVHEIVLKLRNEDAVV